MSRVRVSIMVGTEDPRAALTVAGIADEGGIAAVWVADSPDGAGAGADVMTILAALASTTASVRLGAVIGPVASEHSVHLAEELGVVDQASAGRLEVVLRADSSESFRAQAEAIRGAWAGIALDDGRVVAATPAPHQPVLPMTMLAADPHSGEGCAGRCVPIESAGGLQHRDRGHDTRTILLIEDGLAWAAELRNDPARIAGLIDQLAEASADELVVALDAADPESAETVGFLSSVVGRALAAGSHEAELVLADAAAWHRHSATATA